MRTGSRDYRVLVIGKIEDGPRLPAMNCAGRRFSSPQ